MDTDTGMDMATAIPNLGRQPDAVQEMRALPVFLVVALGLLAAAQTASAQTQAPDPAVRIVPRLEAGLTWTDNVNTSSADKRKDWMVNLAPGITVSRAAGRFRGQLDASLRNQVYFKEDDENESYLAFSGSGEFEAVEDALFIRAQGVVSRNNYSPFGRRFSGDPRSASRDDETRAWSLAPRYQFRFGSNGSGMLSHEWRWLSGGNRSLGDTREKRWLLSLADPSAMRLFGWGLDYQRLDTHYESGLGRDVEQEVGRATLFVNIDPQFRLRFIGGYESNDYEVIDGEEGGIWGVGFDWSPTERTTLSATGEDRVFGRGYDVRFQHRQARTLWQLSATRDIRSTLEELAGGFVLDPVFQFFYLLTDESLPEAERLRLARAAYESVGGIGVRSNAHFLVRSIRGSLSLIGARNTLTFALQRTERDRLNALSGFVIGDDFAFFDYIKTRSASVSLQHRLTPLSSLNASTTYARSQGFGINRQDVRRRIYHLGVTRTLSPRTSATLLYRHHNVSGTDDYTENAISGNVVMRF